MRIPCISTVLSVLRATVIALAFTVLAAIAADVIAADMANGIFLIARHEMRDPRFKETVLLVTQLPKGGPLGVIVNRPLPRLLSEVFPELTAFKGRKDVLFVGG